MLFEEIKERQFEHFHQIIILDENGILVESTDKIFSTNELKGTSVLEFSPLLESIFVNLDALEIGGEEVVFTKLEAPFDQLTGFYDFSFKKVLIYDVPHILWDIFDYTELYEDYVRYQQKKNELEIRRQLLQNKVITNNEILTKELPFHEMMVPIEAIVSSGLGVFMPKDTVAQFAQKLFGNTALMASLGRVNKKINFKLNDITRDYTVNDLIDFIERKLYSIPNNNNLGINYGIDMDLDTYLHGPIEYIKHSLLSLLILLLDHSVDNEHVQLHFHSLSDSKKGLRIALHCDHVDFSGVDVLVSLQDFINQPTRYEYTPMILRLGFVSELIKLSGGKLDIKEVNNEFSLILDLPSVDDK